MEIIFKNNSLVSQTETCTLNLKAQLWQLVDLWHSSVSELDISKFHFPLEILNWWHVFFLKICVHSKVATYSVTVWSCWCTSSTGWSLFPRWFVLQPSLAMLDAWWFYSPSACQVFPSGYINSLTTCLQQVSASNVGRVCTEPAKPARPWETCIIQTASPAARVVSKTANLVK